MHHQADRSQRLVRVVILEKVSSFLPLGRIDGIRTKHCPQCGVIYREADLVPIVRVMEMFADLE